MRNNNGQFKSPWEDSFMKPVLYKGQWYDVETNVGTECVPADVCGLVDKVSDLRDYLEGKPEEDQELVLESGWLCRLSAPGYMDCTEWSGFSSKRAAKNYLAELAGCD